MPSQIKTPGTVTSDSAIGSKSWSGTGNVAAEDGSYATATLPNSESGATSHYLKCTNFGFTIPTGAEIATITATVRRHAVTGGGTCLDDNVYEVNAGSLVGSDLRDADPWAFGANETVNYALAVAASASDINNSGFGIALAAQLGDDFDPDDTVARIDLVQITVVYAGGGAFPPPGGVGGPGGGAAFFMMMCGLSVLFALLAHAAVHQVPLERADHAAVLTAVPVQFELRHRPLAADMAEGAVADMVERLAQGVEPLRGIGGHLRRVLLAGDEPAQDKPQPDHDRPQRNAPLPKRGHTSLQPQEEIERGNLVAARAFLGWFGGSSLRILSRRPFRGHGLGQFGFPELTTHRLANKLRLLEAVPPTVRLDRGEDLLAGAGLQVATGWHGGGHSSSRSKHEPRAVSGDLAALTVSAVAGYVNNCDLSWYAGRIPTDHQNRRAAL